MRRPQADASAGAAGLALADELAGAHIITAPSNNILKVFRGESINEKKNDYALILRGADYLATLATTPQRIKK